MSFWNNDDSAARRREEERQRKAAEERQRAQRIKAQRKATVARQKERQRVRTEQAAEDKKLRDELVEKMLNSGKNKGSATTFPTLNRGLGGDRATPTNQQQCFKHLSKPGESNAAKGSTAEAESGDSGAKTTVDRSFPPLKRPF